MTAQGSPSVLKRKLAAANDDDRGAGRSALRALRLALARVAKELFDLPLGVIGATQARCDHDGVAGFMSDDRLLVLLEGSGGKAGVVSLDGACVAALIQQQTMNRVTGSPMTERAFTGTDAAMAEPLIEALLARAAILSDLADDQRCLSGFRFGAQVSDVRSLLLALEADRFRVFSLTVDIAEGAMQGAICLLLPDLPPDPAKMGAKGKPAQPPGPRMDQAFGVMRAELTATICRLRLSLSELAAMQPGDVLPLMRERLEETELVAIDGRPIAAGRLGQINGLRALRLNETPIAPSQLESPADAGFANQVISEDPGLGGAGLTLGGLSPPEGLPALDGLVPQDGSVTLDGSVAPLNGGLSPASDLPAMVGLDGIGEVDSPQEEESGNMLDRMTPEEAAAEITMLAGLEPLGDDA